MKAGPRSLKKDEILFREGDEPDAAYVIKSGKLAITKAKGSSEIILAELGPGSMLGEMAFFDNRPRSAGAKASQDCTVIALPFTALHAQFKTFPEWLKVMVKTINNHLRQANQRIKNLEKANSESENVFDEYSINQIISILTLVAAQYGTKEEKGISVPPGTLRRYTIQVFQQPTSKMVKLTEKLQELEFVEMEDLGEGRQKIIITKHQILCDFVDYYTKYLFTEESKRTTIEDFEVPILRALVHYGDIKIKEFPNALVDGKVSVDLSRMQAESEKDLGETVRVEQIDTVIEKGLCSDKVSGRDGEITADIVIEDLRPLVPYWTLVYELLALKK